MSIDRWSLADSPGQGPRWPRFWRIASELILWCRTLTSAAVYAAVIVTFGFQIARVEGHSMEPTLHDQDRLVVNRLAYQFHDPEVGDIVMVRHPNTPEQTLVKRIVAAPGDTVAFRHGTPYRNDIRVAEDFVPAALRWPDERPAATVPEGYYFVLGDHRKNSSDSRSFGPVPKKYILGRVRVRWWPLADARSFDPPPLSTSP